MKNSNLELAVQELRKTQQIISNQVDAQISEFDRYYNRVATQTKPIRVDTPAGGLQSAVDGYKQALESYSQVVSAHRQSIEQYREVKPFTFDSFFSLFK